MNKRKTCIDYYHVPTAKLLKFLSWVRGNEYRAIEYEQDGSMAKVWVERYRNEEWVSPPDYAKQIH